MKSKISILIFTSILMTSVTTFAQMPKFGHINSAELLSLMPEVKTTDAKLKQYQQELENQNQKMLSEYQTKVKEYETKQDELIDASKEVFVQEIKDLETRITNFQQSAPEKLENKKEELYNPILEKAQKAIKEVAKENGFTYVFDTSLGVLIEFPDSDNIMELVKKRMNL